MTNSAARAPADVISRRELLVTILAIQVAVLAVVSLAAAAFGGHEMTFYAGIAERIFAGDVPYRDVPLEYPPISLVPILLPRILEVVAPVGGLEGYQSMFLLLMGATSLAVTALVWVLARDWAPVALDPLRPLLYALLLVALASPVLLWRFDLFPAFLTMLAVVLSVKGRPLLGGGAMALAIAAKLYPVVLVPVLIAAYVASKDRSGLSRYLVALVGVGLVLGVGTLLLAPEAAGNVLGYHLERGVQLESTYAGLMEMAHVAGLASATVTDQFNSLQIDSSLTGVMTVVQPIVLIGLLAVVWWLAFRAFRKEAANESGLTLATLVRYLVAALLAFMLGSKVFSPQYLIWILPFAPFLSRTIVILVTVAFAITFLLFPFLYNGLIGLEPLLILLLNGRNLLLVVVLLLLVTGKGAATSEQIRPTGSMVEVSS